MLWTLQNNRKIDVKLVSNKKDYLKLTSTSSYMSKKTISQWFGSDSLKKSCIDTW